MKIYGDPDFLKPRSVTWLFVAYGLNLILPPPGFTRRELVREWACSILGVDDLSEFVTELRREVLKDLRRRMRWDVPD